MREVSACRTAHYHGNAAPHIKIPCNVQAGKGRTFAKMATICLCHVHSVAGTITHTYISHLETKSLTDTLRIPCVVVSRREKKKKNKREPLHFNVTVQEVKQQLLRHLSRLDGCSCAGLIGKLTRSAGIILRPRSSARAVNARLCAESVARGRLTVKVTFGSALVPSRIGAHEADRCNAQRQ